MSSKLVVSCDNCGTQKGSGNHWFIIDDSGPLFCVRPYIANTENDKHACSDACCLAFAQRWLSAQKECAVNEQQQ